MAGNGMYHHPLNHHLNLNHQQQWAPVAAAPSPPQHSPIGVGGEEIRTIFISGLPEDVKERELQNLMRWLPGYEASQINFKEKVPMGFALFSQPHFAIAAKDALQDMLFDSQSNSLLHTEMAKKNLFVKRGILLPDPNSDQSINVCEPETIILSLPFTLLHLFGLHTGYFLHPNLCFFYKWDCLQMGLIFSLFD